VINPSQRPLPDNTQHSQQTDVHAPGGIRTHNLSRRAALDLHLRPRGHWDRQSSFITMNFMDLWNLFVAYRDSRRLSLIRCQNKPCERRLNHCGGTVNFTDTNNVKRLFTLGKQNSPYMELLQLFLLIVRVIILISNFRRDLNIVYVLLGISPASNCSWPTFRNPVSVPSSKAGCRVWGVRGSNVFIPCRGSNWSYNLSGQRVCDNIGFKSSRCNVLPSASCSRRCDLWIGGWLCPRDHRHTVK